MIVNILALLVLIASGMYDLSNLQVLERDSEIITKHFVDIAKNKIEVWKPPNHLDTIFPQGHKFMKLTTWIIKKIGKWWKAHPAELKLTKCLAKFFTKKIFQLKRKLIVELQDEKGQKSGKNDEFQNPETEIMTLEEESKEEKKCEEKNSVCLPGKKEMIRNITRRLLKLKDLVYGYFQDIVLKNKFLLCTGEYFLSRFWIWVDSASDL